MPQMSEKTRTILIGATTIAVIYVLTEYLIKPKVGTYAGVKVK